MELFPREYREQATAFHRLAVAISLFLIVGSLAGLLASLFLDRLHLPLAARRALGIMVLSGAPIGLILLSIVAASLGGRCRRHLLNAREKQVPLSPSSRRELLDAMQYTRYDHRHMNRSFTIAGVLIVVVAGTLAGGLYSVHSNSRTLMMGAILLLAAGAAFLLVRSLASSLFNSSITLTKDGIRFTKGEDSGLLTWDSITEIKNVKNGYLLKSNQTDLMILGDIRPVNTPKSEFFKLRFTPVSHSANLIAQIKTMNPNIVHVEPFLARDLQIPISDRAIGIFLLVILVLFFIVMILSLCR